MNLFSAQALFNYSTLQWDERWCLLFGVSGRSRFGAAEPLFVRLSHLTFYSFPPIRFLISIGRLAVPVTSASFYSRSETRTTTVILYSM
jgi:hypothetical protein